LNNNFVQFGLVDYFNNESKKNMAETIIFRDENEEIKEVSFENPLPVQTQ
jgi:hypothetical protein